nr:RxLR effector protein 64 [Phytophthora cinnamomi]
MRLCLVLLAVTATLLSSCDAAPSSTNLLQTKTQTEKLRTGSDRDSRLLRTQETSTANTNGADDEERAWGLKTLLSLVKTPKPNDFAKVDLDRMLVDGVFKLEMFERWNKYSTEKILATLDLSKRKNIPYGSILQEFLNTYRLRQGAANLRRGNQA